MKREIVFEHIKYKLKINVGYPIISQLLYPY